MIEKIEKILDDTEENGECDRQDKKWYNFIDRARFHIADKNAWKSCYIQRNLGEGPKPPRQLACTHNNRTEVNTDLKHY